jgi:LPS export ABC transporter protein LptC
MNRKSFLILGLVVLFVFAAGLFFGIKKEPPKALLNKMAEKVDLQAKNVRYTQVGSSGMKWEITADSAQYRKKEELALFEKVKVKLFMKDGRTFVMTGDKGVLNTQSRDMDIEGNVVIVSDAGDEFRTDRLSYRDALKRVETDRPVVMENKNQRIRGVGMVLNLNEEKVTLLSGVRAKSFVK